MHKAVVMLLMAAMSSNAAAAWTSWWYPGLTELSNMLAFAFWWVLVFVVVAIPFVIVGAMVLAILDGQS